MVRQIKGVVDEINYVSDDSWTVLRIVPERQYAKALDQEGTVTVVGKMPNFKEGDSVRFAGDWDNHQRYGRQFKASEAVLQVPKTEAEIVAFLSSDQVKGIGPTSARNIVAHFGEAAIEILDEDARRVAEVPGIKNAEIERFIKDWTANHIQRHTLSYLQELGFSSRLARRIYGVYGLETRRTVITDPYQLAIDELITFERADKFAKKLGLLEGHSGRMRAGLVQALYDFAGDGHTYAPRPGVLARAAKFLGMDNDEELEAALINLLDAEQLGEELFDDEDRAKPTRAIYLPRYWHAENAVADKLSDISARPSRLIDHERNNDSLDFIIKKFHRNGIVNPASEQISAVQSALTNKVSVLTGGTRHRQDI